MPLLIRHGRLVDPSQSLDQITDLLISDGLVSGIGNITEPPSGTEIFDAAGKVVSPGFIDIHVHLREPGFTSKETIATGTLSAARGGFSAVCCMANTAPVNDSALVTRYIMDRVKESAAVRVYPIGAITKGLEGQALAEIGGMVEAGAVAISDDGHSVSNSQMMRRALEYAADFGIPVVDHCENKELAAGGVINEGHYSTLLGLRGMTRAAEEVDVARDIVLAELTGAHIHIAHLSTAGSLKLVRRAQAEGLKVTCEVTPHHLTLTEELADGYNPNAKMNPPLRTQADVDALLEGIADGTIGAIATDHAPHTGLEKDQVLPHSPFGIIGLESAVSLMLDRLHRTNHVPLSRIVELFSTGPARLFNLPGGTLKVGAPADVTILDLEKTVRVDVSEWASKSRNTPFDTWELQGAPVAVFINGKKVECK